MKKIIILSILFTLSMAGVLYGLLLQPDELETVTGKQVYVDQSPYQISEFIVDPAPGFPLYWTTS